LLKKSFNLKKINNFSIEVMPRTASKIKNFNDLLKPKTNIYIAHLENVDFVEMLSTAERLVNEGYNVTPHFPARMIKDKQTLDDWVKKYHNVGVKNSLLIAGNQKKPYGEFYSSIDLIRTEVFDKYSFKNIFVAGHPEGNKDIDPEGNDKNIKKSLLWKNEFAKNTDANLSITSQFCFNSETIIKWSEELIKNKIDLPINIGIPGPAKLQTMIKYAISCGVGPSIKILEKRAMDLTKMILPYKPEKLLVSLNNYLINNPNSKINSMHFFPLGGIKKTIEFIDYCNGTLKEKKVYQDD